MIWINRFREIVLNVTKSKWIYRFWHFSMQSLFIINRFEHFESKKSIDSVIYNQYKIFDVFVRIHRNENTISYKMQLEQWARINSILSKIKTYAWTSTRKTRIIQSRIDVFWIWRTYNIFNKRAIDLKKHTICQADS